MRVSDSCVRRGGKFPVWLAMLCWVIATGPFLCTTNAQPAVSLVKEGKVVFHLVLDQSPEGLNLTVAEDLARVIGMMTGADPTKTPTDDSIPLYLGEVPEFPDLPVGVPVLEKESFFLKVSPSGIFILGGSPLGTSHGAYTLLRDLGCRWIMPGEIGECLPHSPDLAIPVQERVEAPDFSYRDIWYAYGASAAAMARRADWLRRNRMNRPQVMHGHNLTNTLGVFAPFEKRPELYSLNEGKRTKNQICTANPEAVSLVIQAIDQYLDQNPAMEAYSLCPDDNTDFCECEHCKALDSGRMDRGGKPSISDRYQVFLNQVLEGLSKKHPDVLVTHYAYNQNHTDTPVNTPVHPNTGIFLTTSVFCSAHGIGDDFCPSRMDFKQLLSEWTAKTRHVYIYEYDPVPYSGGLSWPIWEAHGREMKVYKQLGVQGISNESQDSWASYFPNFYTAAQMMWDADQDWRPIFEGMIDSFFLEASGPMQAYYDSQASYIGKVTKKVEWGLVDYADYFPPEVVEACRRSLEQAEAMATTPRVKERLEMVRLSFDQMDAYLAIRRSGEATTWDQYKDLVARLDRSIDTMEAKSEDYLLANIAREKTKVGLSDRFGPEQGFINQWQLCGPFENLGMQGHDTVYPPEGGIDLAATFPGAGGETVGWKGSTAPEWSGLVDLKKEYDQTENVCAYAACWVQAKEETPVELRVGSNDSVKVFLNGKEVWSNKIERTASVDDDIVPVTLPEGTSEVLLKIGQTGKDWGFYFRLTKPGSIERPEGVAASDRKTN